MTGRDYKQLMKLHRQNQLDNTETHKIFCKLADNPMLIKYQPVNYEIYKDFIKERKQAATVALDKVKKIEDCSKMKKESLFMKQHSMIWLKEWSKLQNQFKTTEAELENCLQFEQNSIDYIDMNEIGEDHRLTKSDNEEEEYFQVLNKLDDLEKYVNQLSEERIKFKVRTVMPINDLKEDLQYYMQIHSSDSVKNNTIQNKHIMQSIQAVKEQQTNLYKKLEQDCKQLQLELTDITNEINKGENIVNEGVPDQAMALESPDQELKFSVLQEFLIIDFKYKEKLKQLDEVHKKSLVKYSGWSTQENELFQHIYEQYHFHNINLNNCNFTLRDLMFDRIRRTLAYLYDIKRERTELVKHEEWLDYIRYFQQQHKLILTEWIESKRSLVIKAEAIFTEAFELIEQQRIKNEEKEKQLRICNELYEKVSRWRKQKLEALEIQMKIDELIKKQEMERTNMENQKKMALRQQQKQAIQDYNNRIEAHRKQQETEEKIKLEKLKKLLNDQAQRDKERIDFRSKMLMTKINHLKSQKQAKLAEYELNEKRLEKITEARKLQVESDPARMISYTESYLNKRLSHADYESKYEDKKEMYSNFSYNDKQLNADARIRIEQRLRQAGLIDSEYARALISNVKPPSLPRRDIFTEKCFF